MQKNRAATVYTGTVCKKKVESGLDPEPDPEEGLIWIK